MGFNSIAIVRDSRTVIKKCQTMAPDKSIIGELIRDIQSKKVYFQEIDFHTGLHPSRTGRKMAETPRLRQFHGRTTKEKILEKESFWKLLSIELLGQGSEEATDLWSLAVGVDWTRD
ncbi:hypothetical protein Goari_020921 [Gossypium aridum]|uniref:RNase H type-1 domain-containing protein n=1 Tax=Gossypium aridum TaxID=34290 RepID=A0A7J8YDL1_GOSAI|nr:hypothetical protein [Gossypium aridum]